VHLVGFIIKKFVTMNCQMDVKYKISLGLPSVTARFLKSKIRVLYLTGHDDDNDDDDNDVITSTGTTELYCPDQPRILIPAIQTTENAV